MDTINVLNILGGFNYGGAENLLINIFRRMDRQKYKMDFLLRNKENREDLLSEIRKKGGKVYTLKSTGFNALLAVEEEQFFQEHAKEYDIIHLHANTAVFSKTLYLAYKYGISIRVLHSHNSSGKNFFRAAVHYWKRGMIKRYATTRIACSEKAGKWMFGSQDVIILENGIDLRKFQYSEVTRKMFREKYGLGDTFVIGTVGRIVKEKNHVFLIKILAELLRRQIDVKVVIIGGMVNKYYHRLLRDVQKRGVEKNVIFTGAVDNVDEMLNMFDLFVLPSLYEGLPIALVEAQANGLPCLVSDSISGKSIFHRNVYVKPLGSDVINWTEDVLKMKEHLGRIDVSPEIYQSVYAIETTVKRLEKLYDTEVAIYGK